MNAIEAIYLGDKKTDKTPVRAIEYFALSRAAFNSVRENFEFSSVRKLIRFTSKIKTIDCSLCTKHIFTSLNDTRQRACLLLSFIVKVTLQYYGEIDFRKAANKPHLLIDTILSFHVVALFGGPNLTQNIACAK